MQIAIILAEDPSAFELFYVLNYFLDFTNFIQFVIADLSQAFNKPFASLTMSKKFSLFHLLPNSARIQAAPIKLHTAVKEQIFYFSSVADILYPILLSTILTIFL